MSCHPGVGPGPADRQRRRGKQVTDKALVGKQPFQGTATIAWKPGPQELVSSLGVGAQRRGSLV